MDFNDGTEKVSLAERARVMAIGDNPCRQKWLYSQTEA